MVNQRSRIISAIADKLFAFLKGTTILPKKTAGRRRGVEVGGTRQVTGIATLAARRVPRDVINAWEYWNEDVIWSPLFWARNVAWTWPRRRDLGWPSDSRTVGHLVEDPPPPPSTIAAGSVTSIKGRRSCPCPTTGIGWWSLECFEEIPRWNPFKATTRMLTGRNFAFNLTILINYHADNAKGNGRK